MKFNLKENFKNAYEKFVELEQKGEVVHCEEKITYKNKVYTRYNRLNKVAFRMANVDEITLLTIIEDIDYTFEDEFYGDED